MESLISEMLHNGLPCHNELYLDGQLHRYGKNGTNDDKDEWYIGWQKENFIYCTYGSWSCEDKFTYTSGNVDREKMLEVEQWVAKQQHEYHKLRIKESLEAKKKASNILSSCTKQDHIYAHNKGIDEHQFVDGNRMVVPYVDFDNELQTLQFIDPDGKKKFMAKGKAKGHFAILGNPLSETKKVYLCEGYATACTVHHATNVTTLCCGSIGNINSVSVVLKGLYIHIKMYLCQDVGEKSDKHAEEWKKQFNGTVHKPDSNDDGYDFNDLHKDSDWKIDSVKRALKVLPFSEYNFKNVLEIVTPPIKWLIPTQIAEGTCTIVHSRGGVGKSRFLYELATACAQRNINTKTNIEYPKDKGTAGRFLWWTIPDVKKVLYIDTEMQTNQIQARLKDVILRREAMIHPDDLTFIMKQYGDENFNLYAQETKDRLDVNIDNNDVIIIDNLQNALVDTDLDGEAKENQAKYWYVFYQWVQSWIKQGKTFFLAHHTGKSGQLRGTSRMEGDADNIIHLKRPEDLKMKIVSDDVLLAFIYEIEKGRDIEYKHRKKFLATITDTPSEFKGGWNLSYLPE